MAKAEMGVLSATTGFGKTVIAAWLISQRRVNTLILVHRKQLQEQWIERLATFLKLPRSSIGRIGGGPRKPTTVIDVALVQSLVRKGVVDDIVSQYGYVIADECHHLPAFSFEQIVRQTKAKFITGLTATLVRKDGHHPIILMRCGPVRYRVDAKAQAALRPFEHTVLVRPTSFSPIKPASEEVRLQFQGLINELIRDEERNQLICNDVIQAVQKGRSPLVLTERNDHLNYLIQNLSPKIEHLVVFRGGMSSKEIGQTMQRLREIPQGEGRLLLAMGRFIGEGFDDARLDTLFLTLPISWRGTLAQYVGRLHRIHALKREVQVYDYVDLGVPMLERIFNRRCRGYEALGYRILLPANAVPGWPTEIPLPVDPAWKADLAHLFIQTAPLLPLDAEGISRARSAAESFLFRRLETLPGTAGRFQLNAELPIPFDGWGRMEVDLLCEELSLVVEIDGAQHLGSREAYRKDRRKDLLLQENGYSILRFLADDISKHLDNVLETILGTLSHCRTKRPELLDGYSTDKR